MESKKINQLATEMSPAATDLTIIGDPITGVSKKITLEQIASLFAGSVSFYANLAAFPVTGTIDTIYCAKDTNKLYLWSGSAYVQTFPSQALLDTYQLRSEKGVSNGYASLDSGGKVPISQLPSSIMEYKGMWSAATNTPTLANGTGDTGDVYICNAAGSVNFGSGTITFAVGDYVIYSGSIWQRSSGAVGTVTSVGLSSATSGVTIGSSPITTSGTITLAIATATTSQNGLLSSTDWATFNAKQNAITLTTTGTSGASTLVGATLNIPNYGSALTGYVPYTGATQDVDLGAFKLNAQSLHAKGTGGLGHLGLKHQSASATASANEVSLFADSLGDLSWLNGNLYLSKFITSGNTAARSYTFPNATGTIALTSDLSAYVTLATTQTISGAKTFSGGVTFSSSVTTNNLTFANSGFFLTLQPPTLSVNRTVTLPNGTGTLALTSDISYPVTSVFGRTGAVVATSGDYTTAQVTESGNLYFTDSRARLALSFVAGSGAYNSSTGVITIPTNNNQITNGAGYTTNVGTVTSVAALTIGTSGTDLNSSVANGTTTPVITLNVPTASASNRGALSSTDWTTFNNKQGTITLTTTGTSGAATFSSNTLNIPNYAPDLSGYVTLATTQTITGAKQFNAITTFGSTGGSGLRVYGGSGTNQWDVYLNSTNLRFSDNTGTGSIVFDRPLSGTSATFSGNGQFGNATTNTITINANTGNPNIEINGGNGSASIGASSYLRLRDATNSRSSFLQINASGGLDYWFQYGGVFYNRITFENTGAATFSSSVTATGFIVGNGQYYKATRNSGSLVIDLLGIESGTDNTRIVSTNDFNIVNGSLVSQFKIASTGAATFSSSVGIVGAAGTNGSKLFVQGSASCLFDAAGTRGISFYPSQSSVHLITSDYIGTSYYPLALSARAVNTDLYINTNGQIGIGCTPSYQLDVNGTGRFTGALSGTSASFSGAMRSNGVEITNTANADILDIFQSPSALNSFIDYPSGRSLIIRNKGTLNGLTLASTGAATFSSGIATLGYTASTSYAALFNGSVGIGTNSPSYTFDVSKTVAADFVARIANTSSTGFGLYVQANDNSKAGIRIANASGGTAIDLFGSGAATFTGSVTATSFFESSDSRLKTLIQDNYQTKGIASITPKLYIKNGKVELGYYAQDFVGVLDSAVSKGSDDMLSLSYREVHTAKIYALEQEIKELKAKMN